MKKLTALTNSWIKSIAKVLSLATVALVFQACYGSPNDYGTRKFIQGKVQNREGEPIPNVKVIIDGTRSTYTKTTGEFAIYTLIQPSYSIQFLDNSAIYNDKDTTIDDRSDTTLTIILNRK